MTLTLAIWMAVIAVVAFGAPILSLHIDHKRAEKRKAALEALNAWIDLAERIEAKEAAEANRNFDWED